MTRRTIEEVADGFDTELKPVVVYQAKNDSDTKTMTFRLRATSHEKTLRDDDVNQLLDSAVDRLKQHLDIVRV